MPKKIFIIEDDESILYGLQDRLTSDGYDVDISNADEDLEELLKRIKKYQPQFLILDLLLPKTEGLEIVKRLKGDEESSDIQVLIFTDLSDEDSKARSIGLGVNHYFMKSEMDVNEFVDRIEKIMSGDSEKMAEAMAAEDGDDVVLD
jgi:DNA-binding response OmpR family regulator